MQHQSGKPGVGSHRLRGRSGGVVRPDVRGGRGEEAGARGPGRQAASWLLTCSLTGRLLSPHPVPCTALALGRVGLLRSAQVTGDVPSPSRASSGARKHMRGGGPALRTGLCRPRPGSGSVRGQLLEVPVLLPTELSFLPLAPAASYLPAFTESLPDPGKPGHTPAAGHRPVCAHTCVSSHACASEALAFA